MVAELSVYRFTLDQEKDGFSQVVDEQVPTYTQ
jgi:hypothetical protein